MGTFGGHVLPGTFLILISVWHIVQLFRRYFQTKRENSTFTDSLWFPFDFLCGRFKEWPIEPCLKIMLSSTGLFLEIYTGTRNGVFDAPGNEQHATMFFFFGLTGLFDLLVHFRANLPPFIDNVSVVNAFAIEFILFRFHLHGRKDLDVLLHTLLLYAIAASLLSILARFKYQHNILISLALPYCFLLQGTWFWQIAFILYNPVSGAVPWNQDSHRQMMTATAYFTWHVGFNFIFIVLVGALISCLYKQNRGYTDDNAMVSKRLIHTNSNGQTIVNMNDDSEEEGEF